MALKIDHKNAFQFVAARFTDSLLTEVTNMVYKTNMNTHSNRIASQIIST